MTTTLVRLHIQCTYYAAEIVSQNTNRDGTTKSSDQCLVLKLCTRS